MTLAPVGPAPVNVDAVKTADGTLVVYSACQTNADCSTLDPDQPVYSDYEIYTAAGKLLQQVHNRWGGMLQDAAPVALPAGRYRVVARTNGYGVVTVPVVIGAGQRTVLHLEGGAGWPDRPAATAADTVRLPDGQIVGWKAAASL